MPETPDRALRRHKARKKRRAVREAITQPELAEMRTFIRGAQTSARKVKAATKLVKAQTNAPFIGDRVALSTIPLTLKSGEVYGENVVAAASNPPTYAVDPKGRLQAPKHFGGSVLSTVRHEVTHLIGQRVTGQQTGEVAIKAAGVDVIGSSATSPQSIHAAISLDIEDKNRDSATLLKRKLAKFRNRNKK